MAHRVHVSGRTLGSKKTLFADWSVPFPPNLEADGGRTTLHDLISCIVRAEVEGFRKRQEDRKMTHALTARQIGDGAAKGKITSGGIDLNQTVDEEFAVESALQAFEDGLFLVIVDDTQERDLDREVYLRPDSKVTFLRLTMLAGG